MLEKPNLSDDEIIAAVEHRYALSVTGLEFLPIGNESNAWVYRVNTDYQPYFLKVKKGAMYQPSVVVPAFLKTQGIHQVVAPLPTVTGELWAMIDPFTLILYPFIDGKTGMEQGMSSSQWMAFGSILKKIHGTLLPEELLAQMQRENFLLNSQWISILGQVQEKVQTAVLDDAFARELAAFWKEKHSEISSIVDRAAALGRSLQNRSLAFMLCHADIHTANVLVDKNGDLFIVDWDQPVIAPKERDLMFVASESGIPSTEETAFFQGYGEVEIDRLALAYYRYEWVVQEFADYGARVFLSDEVGAETKQDAVRGFYQLFDPGDVIDGAYKAEAYLPKGRMG